MGEGAPAWREKDLDHLWEESCREGRGQAGGTGDPWDQGGHEEGEEPVLDAYSLWNGVWSL